MKALSLIVTVTLCTLLAGCGQSKELTTRKAQHALDQVPHTSGKIKVAKIRVQGEWDGVVDMTLSDFGYTDKGVSKKCTGPGSALFNKDPDGQWKLKAIHLGEPPVNLEYDIVAQ